MEHKMRLIDANEVIRETESILNFRKQHFMPTEEYEALLWYLKNRPTIDAVEVDVVAQMLYEAIGDYCPCNFNDNDEWLTLVCDDCNVCGEHDDPLYCWKQYIKHYGERKDNG